MKSPVLVDVIDVAKEDLQTLKNIFKDREIINAEDQTDGDYSGIQYALVWKPKSELFSRMPDLQVIFSLGAGVDHIFEMGGVPDLPIVRFVDQNLTTRMSEWICLQCLMHLRHQRAHDKYQRECEWKVLAHPHAGEVRVGIMGLGTLGLDAAQKLLTLGFQVNGWSRTKKSIDGVKCFGEQELDAFLSSTDYLVGLLPLTEQTTGIFNRKLFTKLARRDDLGSPVFINAGRGKSQIESDIIECLQDSTLAAVSLDVFENEPLLSKSPLWDFEQAILTPHIAADSDFKSLGEHIERQIERYESGKSLEFLVDRSMGY